MGEEKTSIVGNQPSIGDHIIMMIIPKMAFRIQRARLFLESQQWLPIKNATVVLKYMSLNNHIAFILLLIEKLC